MEISMTILCRLGAAMSLLVVGLAPAAAQSAQKPSPTTTGTWIIAGSGEFSRSVDEEGDQAVTSFGLAPTAMRLIIPRLAIGASLVGSYFKAGDQTGKLFGIGPRVHYYFGDAAGSMFPFVGAGVSREWNKIHSTSGGQAQDADATRTAVELSAGLTKLIATHVGITAEAFWTKSSQTTEGFAQFNEKNHQFGVRFSVTAFVF